MIPKEIAEDFEIKDINIQVSKFEEYMLQDIYMSDEDSKLKLNRDVTQDFINEIKMFKDQKRNIRLVIKGQTRSGKSLIGLKVGDIIIDDETTRQNFEKDIDSIVCGSQNEYKSRLQNAEFGDFYLVDENFFSNSGLGTNIDKAQLQDYNNVIAKKNISVLFITPEKFLNVGATMGLSSYGRDSKNWLSRFLVYNFQDSFPHLIGYIIIDVGALFRKYGCYIYKQIGGCNNTNKVDYKDIKEKYIKHSSCIPDYFEDSELINNHKTCPFFNICKHPLCKYEHKKDSWIEKEMKGGLDMRTEERYTIALKLILMFNPEIDFGNNQIKLTSAKNQKDVKSQADILMPTLTNTKFGVAENDLIIQSIISNTKLPVLANTLVLLENEKLLQMFLDLDDSGHIKNLYENAKNIIAQNREI